MDACIRLNVESLGQCSGFASLLKIAKQYGREGERPRQGPIALQTRFLSRGGICKDPTENIVEDCGIRKMMLVKDILEYGWFEIHLAFRTILVRKTGKFDSGICKH